ncbi:MAG: hypothetical protein LBQ49_01155 [Rickettsiales bacterium]|nr:hypothetical protein [Rickettsiales bacterium]
MAYTIKLPSKKTELAIMNNFPEGGLPKEELMAVVTIEGQSEANDLPISAVKSLVNMSLKEEGYRVGKFNFKSSETNKNKRGKPSVTTQFFVHVKKIAQKKSAKVKQ